MTVPVDSHPREPETGYPGSGLQSCSEPNILAIEDDPILGAHLKASLENCGFNVTLADEGPRGLALASAKEFDLILLDVLLPGLNGMELLTQLRAQHQTPVIMMSALGDEANRIKGFDSGADDYLPKPFSIRELRVRIEAILRRVAYERGLPSPATSAAELAFDDERSDLCHEGCWLGLTLTEYRLLHLLHRHAGEVLSKPFLYQQVLHRAFSQHDRSLDMHISNLRRKLTRANGAGLRLESVWGQGYLLNRQDG